MEVHHITPGRPDKNFGKAINTLVKHLPDEDWICLRDLDTMPTIPTGDYLQIVHEIAETTEFGVVGAMTNRQGLGWLCYGGKISKNWDMKEHFRIGRELRDKHGSDTIMSHGNSGVAGTFMLFSKKTWKRVDGFSEGGVRVKKNLMLDYDFCMDVKLSGLRMGVAQGIYIFHSYRPDSPNPMTDIQHLL